MGWRRTLISIQAAARQAERDRERHQRQMQREDKERLKEEAIAAAENAVSEHANEIRRLTTAHHRATDQISWQRVYETEEPSPPLRGMRHEDLARRALDSYRPSFFDKLLGRTKSKQDALLEGISRARGLDDREFNVLRSDYGTMLSEWKGLHDIAAQILSGEKLAFLEALKEFQSEITLSLDITALEFRVYSSGQVVATLGVRTTDAIPRERLMQLRSGKLSSRPYPKGEFYKLYSDYVCASALRIAREILAILPASRAFVNVETKVLEGSTGRLVERPILSIAMPRESLVEFEWEQVDPTLALEKLAHVSGLRKLGPPEPIEPLIGIET